MRNEVIIPPIPSSRGKGNQLPIYTPTDSKAGKEGTSLPDVHGRVKLVEIFDSIQGEGINVGVPMTFVRFANCNLACDFCDTPYNRVAITMSQEQLLENLLERDPRWVLFTGGEPMLQLTPFLTQGLKEKGIRLTGETNGMIWNPAILDFDHVTISPKLCYDVPSNRIDPKDIIHKDLAQCIKEGKVRLHEVRYLICGPSDDIWQLPWDIRGDWIVLSPVIDDPALPANFQSGQGMGLMGVVNQAAFNRCMYLVHKYRHLNARISLQTHKWVRAR